jgi:two-component system, cell cycle sensor histidine kinase and response regulator CckA
MNAKRNVDGPPVAVVVNDDALQLKLLSGLLAKGGFQVMSFLGAAEALAYMQANGAPDIIVTDLYMPELDGWRFCRLLRSHEYVALNATPIMVISATFSGEATSRITTDLGADAFLAAPVDGRELIETANALLQGRRLIHRPCVLIATDDPMFSRVLEEAFDATGYQTLAAFSGEEICKVFEECPVDILIIDSVILTTTGTGLFDQVRSYNPDCISVVLAANPNPEQALAWMQHGVSEYLRKPVTPEHLLEVCIRAQREKALLRVEDLLDKRTQDALEQEKQIQSVFRTASIGIGIEVNRVFVDVNDEFCTMSGYTRKELIGKSSRMLYPNDRDYESIGHEKDRQISENGNATGTLETQLVRKNGEIIEVLLQVTAIDKDDSSRGTTFTVLDITGRKRTENRLRESRQLLRDVMDTVPACVFWKDRDSRYLGCNISFARDAGCEKPDDIIGKTDYELGWHQQADQYRADDAWVMKTGNVKLGYEEAQTTPSGGLIWLRTSKVPLRNTDGNIIGVLGTYENITEQKRVSHALHINAERLSLSLKAGRVGIWEFWPFEEKVYYNESWFTILGYSPNAYAQHYNTWRDLMHPDDRDHAEAYVNANIHTGRDFDLQFRMKSKDGEWRWIQAYGYVVELTADGKAAHITGTHTDITERKLAELALRESEERFRGIYEVSPIGIVLINTESQEFVDANEGFVRIVGYTRDELRVMTVKDITPPEDWGHEEIYNKKFIAGEVATYELEKRFIHKDGSPRWVIVSADFLHLESIPHPVACGTVVDITDRKRAEEERESLQEQLLQAQKMESIGRLAGGVAHDFNNMLAVIIGQTELALEQINPESQLYVDLQEIELATQRSIDLTRQLLAFARKESITPRVLDVNDLVARMLKMLQRLIGENVELDWRPAANLWPILIDPSQLDQIIANLAINARDAITEMGKLVIETANVCYDKKHHARLEIPEGEYVMITVKDTGIGMDANTVEHIFEPFFTTKEEGRGTGLGLSTVYGAVKQNAGHIFVDSKPNKGTTFTIFLPRTTESGIVPPKTTPTELAGNAETVLLAEDEPSILHLTKRALEKYGYNALPASSTAEALEIARTHEGPIHLLLSDVVMPGMNGPTLYENIKSFRPDIKALYMSGYTGDTLLNHGVSNQNPNFLQKPFSIKVLIEKIQEHLLQ